MVRTLLNIQLLFYGSNDFRKIANFNQFKNIIYYLGMEMNGNIMHVKKN
jgi:hypothetical protein